jgi:hypothetical protein
MSTEKDGWRLSYDERLEARQNGLNETVAAHFGADPATVKLLTAKNVHNITHRGVFGFMEVTAEWTDGDKWHWHSLRFNGEQDIALSQEQLTLLGKFACARETDVRNYTYGYSMGDPRREQREATVHEMPVLAEIIPAQPQAESEVTAA